MRESRDIVISVLVDRQIENCYIIAWINKQTYIKYAEDGYCPDEDMHWYKYTWSKGYHIRDLQFFFDNINRFLEFIKNKE